MTEPDTDTDLHAQWRKHSIATPPAALDDAIRAAAHRAVRAKPSALRARAPWPTWATFVAAASIGVIAIGVWQLQPRDVDEIRSVTSDVPAPTSTAAGTAAPHARAEGAIVAVPAVREELRSSKAADAGRAQEMAKQEMDRQASPPISEEKQSVALAKKRDIAADNAVAQSKVVAADRKPDAVTAASAAAAAAAAALPGAATDRKTEAAAAAAPGSRKPSPFPANDATRADNAASPTAPAQPTGASPAASAQLAGVAPSASAQLAGAPGVAAPPGAPRPMLAQAARPPAPSMTGERSAESNVASPTPRDKTRSVADYVDMLHRERAEQRESDARATLAAMRAEYADADARLPEDLRVWAAQVAPLRK